jgi:hypothetical protein
LPVSRLLPIDPELLTDDNADVDESAALLLLPIMALLLLLLLLLSLEDDVVDDAAEDDGGNEVMDVNGTKRSVAVYGHWVVPSGSVFKSLYDI